jgi:protein tyrosine phosphatase (PTP) superfamily phosphohydrolase (DUF442 family)
MHRISRQLLGICLTSTLLGCSEQPEDQAGPAPTPVTSAPSSETEDANAIDEATDPEIPVQTSEDPVTEEDDDVTTPPDSAPLTEKTPDPTPEPPALPEDAIGVAEAKAEWSELFNKVFQSGDTYFAGIPTEEGLRRASDAGVVVVVSLLTDAQHENIEIDEEAILQELDISFVRIPISPSMLDVAAVDHFATLMEQNEGKVLVHCGSSNRVGGLWALFLYLHEEMELETAIDVGKSAGLRSGWMEDAVRRVAESR